MSINQTELYDALQELTQREDVRAEFIYGFLNAYGFAKNTITQLRNGGARNVAKIAGDVALKGQLYFNPVQAGENVHEVAERLRIGDAIKAQKIRFVIATDFEELVAYDLKADERMETPFTELHQQYSFFLPLAGLEKSYTHSESVADVKAAEKMGRLFDLIRERNEITTAEEVHALNVFLTRLLFCFFAEDTGIFGKHQFTDAIKSTTQEGGDDVAELLDKLFAVLNSPGDSTLRKSMPAHLNAFPYVNGGLFEQQLSIPTFGAKSRRLLLECGTLGWSQINPDIFGSMFQAVIDEEQRSAMGQHYTSVSNIMKVIKPLFLDKLYAELERSRNSEKKLQSLLERVGQIKVFDPACGSGNFLIIAYKELRRFEMEVFRALTEGKSKQTVMGSVLGYSTNIKLSQFYGIEIDDFAHEIALLSLWLAEHQMHQEFKAAFGHAEAMLPLKASGNVFLGNSLSMSWNDVCPKSAEDEVYIIGNPPFLGKHNQSKTQRADQARVTSGIKAGSDLDFVACWFLTAARYIKQDAMTRAAFVATNSITQGEQVSILWREMLHLGVQIDFAYRSFVWTSAAKGKAAVHCAIIGFGYGCSDEPKLIFESNSGNGDYVTIAGNINPYLINAPTIVVGKRSAPICRAAKMSYGNKPSDGGNLILSAEEASALIAVEPNAQPWLRKYIGAYEFINGVERWCLWLRGITLEELIRLPMVRQRVEAVRSFREKSTAAPTVASAATPELFFYASHPESEYIVIPETSSERRKYIPIGYASEEVISSNATYLIADPGLYTFGVLNSTMHNDWMRTVGGRLKSDYRYSASLIYNTFPWPEATDSQRRLIETLAEDVLMARENYPDRSLANLYDPDKMPDNLKAAHKALDVAVEGLYRSRPFRDASERLEYLFARYEMLIEQERQQKEVEAAAKKTRKFHASKTIATE